MFESFEWSFTIILAPIVLAAAIAFALWKRRRPTPAEREVQVRETRKRYHDEDDQA